MHTNSIQSRLLELQKFNQTNSILALFTGEGIPKIPMPFSLVETISESKKKAKLKKNKMTFMPLFRFRLRLNGRTVHFRGRRGYN